MIGIHRSRRVRGTARRRAIQFESLERRALLSGDITAEVLGGQLVIKGDEADNALAITMGTNPGEIVLTGLNGTTINGADQPFIPKAGFRNVSISMRGGADDVRIGGESVTATSSIVPAAEEEEEPHLLLPGNLDIDTGAGADQVRISFTDIVGNVSISTGKGDDKVDIGRGPTFGTYEEGTRLATASAIEPLAGGCDCGGGDSGSGNSGPPADILVGGRLVITTDDGNDAVKVAFAKIGDRLRIDTGAGADYIVTGRGPIFGRHGAGGGEEGGGMGGGEGGEGSSRPVDTRVGTDIDIATGSGIIHTNAGSGNIDINAGSGNDFVMLRNAQGKGTLMADTGTGNDSVGTQNLKMIGATLIQTKEGQDTVALLDSKFDGSFDLRTGPGSDLVYIDATTFKGRFDLQADSDDLSQADVGNDIIVLSQSTFKDRVNIDTGPGDDVVAVVNQNQFSADVTLVGGAGSDTLVDDGTNVGFSNAVLSGFEIQSTTYDVQGVYSRIVKLFGPFLQGR